MVDLKKTLKKIAAIIALGATLGATGVVAYEGGMKSGAKGAFSYVASVNLRNDSIAIKKFEMSMGYAKKTLDFLAQNK